MARIQQVDASIHSSAGLSRGRNADVLSARTADRVIEQFERDPLAHLKVPELAQKIRLVEKDITRGALMMPLPWPRVSALMRPFVTLPA
jgi:hypothetical protein